MTVSSKSEVEQSQARSRSGESQDIDKLKAQYPQLWEQVRSEIPKLFQSSTPAEIAQQAQALKNSEKDLRNAASRKEIGKSEALRRYAEIRMRIFAMQRFLQEAVLRAAGPKLSKRDQQIAQRLFFTSDHRRRAVSATWFPLFWKMISNKAGVVQELKSRGIYCVYSQQFGSALAKLVGKRSCVEIGAGDGTLTLLLEGCGLRIPATDDKSWQHVVRYPDWVEKMDAGTCLRKYQPQVVICSWPPPNNDFEAEIFACPSVETYIMIGSKHHYASGNRKAYELQRGFTMRNDQELGRLVLPPEFDNEVLVFHRG